MILREKVKPSTKSLLVPEIVTTRNLSFGCLFSLNNLTRLMTSILAKELIPEMHVL